MRKRRYVLTHGEICMLSQVTPHFQHESEIITDEGDQENLATLIRKDLVEMDCQDLTTRRFRLTIEGKRAKTPGITIICDNSTGWDFLIVAVTSIVVFLVTMAVGYVRGSWIVSLTSLPVAYLAARKSWDTFIAAKQSRHTWGE
jgi:hypothetical protein